MAGRTGAFRAPAGEGTSTASEMYSKADSRQVMEAYFALVQAVHNKTRSYQALLTDFLNLTELYDKQRKLFNSEQNKRKQAESELGRAEERIRLMQEENEEKERSNRTLNAQLKDARAQVANQLGKINALQTDLDEWENRMDIIKTNLKEQLESLPSENTKWLEFMREPSQYRSHSRAYAQRRGMLAVEEKEEEEESVDYDKTEGNIDEDYEIPAHTRSDRVFCQSNSNNHRSTSAQPAKRSRAFATIEEEIFEGEVALAPRKKRSREGVNLTTASTEVTTTITVDMRQNVNAKVAIRRSMNRSMSESNLLERGIVRPVVPMLTATSTLDLRSPRAPESWTRGRPIELRGHRFEKLTSFFKMTSCDVCNGGINFAARAAVRCIDCSQHVHERCEQRLGLPCIPKSVTPRTPANTKIGPRLQEFCPPTAPMIPAPLIHCVVALERRGLEYPGIYRICGNQAQVDRLLRELKTSRAVPKLELQEVEVITSCIKRFLRELRDPLIPKTSREEFVRAATTSSYNALRTAIRDLPQPNRDTLAYLCLHWLKVIDRSALNKMPLSNVVRCVAPTVIGEGRKPRSEEAALDDIKEAIAVLEALLKLDTVFWEQFLVFDSVGKSTTGYALPATPRAPPLLGASARTATRPHHLDFSPADHSLLGPISSEPRKAPPTPLIFDNRSRGGVTAKKYFPSPL